MARGLHSRFGGARVPMVWLLDWSGNGEARCGIRSRRSRKIRFRIKGLRRVIGVLCSMAGIMCRMDVGNEGR